MSSAPTAFEYGLDGTNAIRAVSDAWIDFARANGAPQLTREAVVGRSLWRFIAGDTTRDLYEVIFARVRRDQERLVLPFRCDSPDRFRFMQLVVAPGTGGGLNLAGILLREQARPYLPILDRLRPRSPGTLPMCSVCMRLQILGNQWVEAVEAVERLDLFDSARLPTLDPRICEDCDRRVRAPQAAGASA
ncbi:MAG: hypothetical protein QNK04_25080 [Myxococcota bacterium]|nr:hypothetical protein [Myxococcota bacterium]